MSVDRNHASGGALRRLLMATAALGLCAVANTATAQTTNSGTVEELVVTARRTAENLQDIPLAVSALSDKTLRNNNIVNVQSMNGLVPSLNYQFSGFRSGTGRVFFRGLTTGAGGQATRASIFVDGNYIAGSAQNIPFNYFSRVEALPGPQSAQFGRATFGGAINYVTKTPGDKISGVVHADYASYGDKTIDGLIGGPILEGMTGGKLKAQLFGSYQKFDAPDAWRAPPDILHPNGVRQGLQESKYFAGKLVYEASENLTLRLGASYAQFDDGPPPFYLVPPGALKNGSLQRYTANDLSRPVAGSFLRYPVGSLAFFSDNVSSGIGIMQNYYNIPDPSLHDFNHRYDGQIEWKVANHDVTLNLFHENETSKGSGLPDGDNTYFPASSNTGVRNTVESNSAEIRIASPTDQRLRYTVGGYYLKFDTAGVFTNYQHFRCTDVVVGCTTTSLAALYNPTLVNGSLVGFTGTAVLANTRTLSSTTTSTIDKAAFGMLSFDITDQLNATAEVRYQSEELESRNLVSGFIGNVTNKSFVPRVTLQYKFTPDVMAFAVYSVGNNPGGFNPGVASFLTLGATADQLSFKEEKLKNYELGIKSTLLDGHLVVNATIFQMDWIDQVSSTTLTATNGVLYSFNQNRGNSRVRGGEVQVSLVPLENLTINATASYNDAKYVSYCSSSAINIIGYQSPGKVGCYIVDGNYLENVPPVTASLSADYHWPVFGEWEAFVGGTYRYRSGQWESDLNLAQSASQNIFDARIGVENERFTLSLFCANCSNELQPDRATNLADVRLGSAVQTNRTASAGIRRPRQYGIRTSLRF